MKPAPAVTWLLPIKNGMPFLPDTLTSLAAQTCRDWEILAWDNGSDDGSIDELKKWIPSRLPGRLIIDRPLSLGACLAEMVRQARTPLCARIDADDINLPHRLARQLEFIQARPEVTIVGCQVHRIDENGVDHGPWDLLPFCHEDIVHTIFVKHVLWHPGVLFRREAVLTVGNYCDLDCVEDYDLWMRLAMRYRLANLDEVLLLYRIHERSVSQTATRSQRLRPLTTNCICHHAPALFGCSQAEARQLRERQHPCAIVPLFRIAMHLCQKQGGSLWARLRSDSFVRSGITLTARNDILSLLILGLLYRRKDLLVREIWQRIAPILF